MTDTRFGWHRYATISALAERAGQPLGRTAMMKLCYFLQALRGVPLGYHFTLYSYGPFDSTVLDDLAYAKVLEAVNEETILFGNGYGYRISAGPDPRYVQGQAADFLEEHEEDIAWVLREFGDYSAADLELMSTMIFVDREAARKGEPLDIDGLVKRVLSIKPRFQPEQARPLADQLAAKGLFKKVAA
jgi:uncharacterized protein